ncbi:addiction module antidote protein [Pseudanabaena sp. PCC 6802]|uniref:addiction module antidote protein n=1 Tax=Pseudanabaena sp. PCC 6802 TaxID=118173 RepID=UPI000348DF88|nr:addiction module antidote protein [Pseudanabaena sp. PCC 6802]
MGTLHTKPLEEMLHDDLTNPEFVAGYLQTALEENGMEGFLVALRQVVKVNKGVREVAQELSVGRESLYKSLSENGNPGLSTINNVLNSVGIGIVFTPLPMSSSEDVSET